MRPVLFRWGKLTIWSYPAMLYLGLVLGVVAGNVAAHTAGIDPLRTYFAILILIIPALAGARLLYVAMNWTVHGIRFGYRCNGPCFRIAAPQIAALIREMKCRWPTSRLVFGADARRTSALVTEWSQ
jgi:hypothetical protein